MDIPNDVNYLHHCWPGPDVDASDAKADIVAVHGINGHPYRTWTHCDNSSTKNWLLDFLPKHVPAARIMSFGFWESGSLLNESCLNKIARNLLEQLWSARKTSENRAPLVFVAHSLGGVIVKELLWIANNEAEYLAIAVNVKLLIFFGTPTSCWETTAFNVTLASTEVEPFASRRHEVITDIVKNGPHALADVSWRFRSLANQYKIHIIYEQQETSFLGIVVPEHHTTLRFPGCESVSRGRQADHLRLCQFSSEDDDLEFICGAITEAAGTPLADVLPVSLQFRKTITTLYHEASASSTGTHTPKTMQWTRLEIVDSQAPVLHVRGQVGTGKTVLCACLADLFQQETQSVVLSFSFNRSYISNGSLRDLVLSFLRQLLFWKPAALTDPYVNKIYETVSKEATWTTQQLWCLLCAIVTKSKSPFIIIIDEVDAIDTIDECDATQLLRSLLGLFRHVATSSRLIIASRPIDGIIEALEDFDTKIIDLDTDKGMEKDHGIFLEQFAISQDAAHDLRRMNMPFLKLETTIEYIKANPSQVGQPQWTRFSEQLQKPTILQFMYRELLLHTPVSEQSWAYEVLGWLLYSVRPLTLDDLSTAVAISLNFEPKDNKLTYPEDEKSTYLNDLFTNRAPDEYIRQAVTSTIQRVLGPLLDVRHDCVRLKHNTVGEFLLQEHAVRKSLIKDRLIESDSSSDTVWFSGFGRETPSYWHFKLAASCMRYLSFQEVEWNGLESNALPTDSALLKYAALHWATHLQLAELTDRDLAYTRQFMKNSTMMLWWYKVQARWKPSYRSSQAVRQLASGAPDMGNVLEISAYLGLDNVINAWDPEDLLDSTGVYKALCFAVQEGHTGAVRALLAKSPFAERRDWSLSAMKDACLLGHQSTAKCILEFLGREEHGNAALQSTINECLCLVAFHSGSPQLANLLLEAGADVNTRHSITVEYDATLTNATPLILAAYQGFEQVVQHLMDHQADIHSFEERKGFSALHSAVRMGHLAVVECLLKIEKCDVNLPTKNQKAYGYRPIHLAAKHSRDDIIETLSHANCDLEAIDSRWNFTALHHAAYYSNAGTVDSLLRQGVDASPRDDEGFTPLILACMRSEESVVDILLNHDVDVECQVEQRENKRAIHFAAQNGHLRILQALLKAGANENALANGNQTPLHMCYGVDVLEALIEYGADVNRTRDCGSTVLHIAVQQSTNPASAVKALLHANIDADKRNKENKTALMLATEVQDRELMGIFLDHGVDAAGLQVSDLDSVLEIDPTQRSTRGKKWLLSAIENRKPGSVALLLEAGIRIDIAEPTLGTTIATGKVQEIEWLLADTTIDISMLDQYGRSLLFISAAAPSIPMTQRLLEHGVDPARRDQFGRQPYDVACTQEIRDLLSKNKIPSMQNNSLICAKNAGGSCLIASKVERGNLHHCGWGCDICYKYFCDEIFYHRCNQETGSSYDLCFNCYSTTREHNGEMKVRFLGTGMFTFEEFSPGITDFGRKL